MMLNFQKTGKGDPVVILHGLYGSGDNWLSIANELKSKYCVYLPDLRNHGKSFHSSDFNYDVMVTDLLGFFAENHLHQAIVLGHSMGGKLAMKFALEHPAMVEKLIVVDIAPKSYINDTEFLPQMHFHESIMKALLQLPIDKLTGRMEADKWLSDKIHQPNIRQFLLKNLRRTKDKAFYWQLNLSVLSENLSALLDDITCNKTIHYEKPALFIRGEHSPYIDDDDEESVSDIFPKAQVITIFDAGHWVHAEQPERFMEVLNSFLYNA